MLAWAPKQNVSDLDPLGCMAGLTLVAKMLESETIGWGLPQNIGTSVTNTFQEAVSLPKVGDYQMEKLFTDNMVYNKQ